MNETLRTAGAVIYSTFIVAAFSTVCVLLYFAEIPVGQEKYAIMLLGALTVELGRTGAFWTGSTASSAAKDKTISDIAKAP